MKNINFFFLLLGLLSGCGVNVNPEYEPTGRIYHIFHDLGETPLQVQVDDVRSINNKIFYREKLMGGWTDYFEQNANGYLAMMTPASKVVEHALNRALSDAGYTMTEDAPVKLKIALWKFLAVEPDTWDWSKPSMVTADIELVLEISKTGRNVLRKRVTEHFEKPFEAFRQQQDPEVVLSACLTGIVEKIASDTEIAKVVRIMYGKEMQEEGGRRADGRNIPGYSIPKAKSQTEVKTGTAFVVSHAGHLITAYHIVKDTDEIKVKFQNEDWYHAELQKYSLTNDVAILKIERPNPDYLSLVDFSVVQQGQKIFTLGYPVVSILGGEPKYSEGTISSLSGIAGEHSLMQISVPVQPGNSGGPLVNISGNVVGMITSTAAVKSFFKHTGTLPQNINWAVKSDYIIPLLPKDYKGKTNTESKSINESTIAIVKRSVCFVEAK